MAQLRSQSAASREGVLEARAERRILLIRGQRILLDSDLAQLYGVTTGALVQAVERNSGGSRTTSCSASPPRSFAF
jgi:hypothetical protein